MSKLPLDASDKRLHKMYLLAEYCANFSDGCSETHMIKFAKGFGNIVPTIMKLLADMGENGVGLVTRIGTKYYVTNTNYISWGEAKGFRERIYNTKCTNQECGILYGSTVNNCPHCGTPNALFSNEAPDYTHTTLESEPTNQTDQTTEPNTHIHTKTPTPREKRVQEGRKAENKAVKFLNQFGEARLGKGRGGEPDLFFSSKKAKYAVEVKSVEHQVKTKTGHKAGSVSLSVAQWTRLVTFSGLNNFVPLLLVMVHVRGSNRGPMYHFVPSQVVNDRLSVFEGKHLRISVLDLPAMSLQTIRVGLNILGGFRL